MMHPNWLLLAALLSLWGSLSQQPSHAAEHFARGVDHALHDVGWQDFERTLVCAEGDPLAAECR